MRHALLQLLCVLLTAWLPSGQEVGLALQVGESVTHDALAGAAAAATLGGRVFIATRTGTVSVLQVLLPSSLVVLGSLQDASFASASALAVAEDPENSGAARLFLTLTTGSLLSLHCAADGQLSLLGGVDAPAMLAGANSLALRGSLALVAAVATGRVVSVDVSRPGQPVVLNSLRLTAVESLSWPEDGLVRVASAEARRLTILSVTSAGGLGKHGSVKDVRLGGDGSSTARALLCTDPSSLDAALVLSDAGDTTLSLLSLADRGVPIFTGSMSATGPSAPDALPDDVTAWPLGFGALRGAAALACANGSAYLAVPGTASVQVVHVGSFGAVYTAAQGEALSGVGVLALGEWGMVGIAPGTGTATLLLWQPAPGTRRKRFS